MVVSGGSGQAFGFGPPFHIAADTDHPAYPSNLSQCVLDGERRERNKEAKGCKPFLLCLLWLFWPHKSHIGIGGGCFFGDGVCFVIVVTAPVLPLHAHAAMSSGPISSLDLSVPTPVCCACIVAAADFILLGWGRADGMSVGKGGRVVGSACVEKFLAALSYSLTGMGRGREKTIKYSNWLRILFAPDKRKKIENNSLGNHKHIIVVNLVVYP